MLSYLHYSCSEEQRGQLQRRLTLPRWFAYVLMTTTKWFQPSPPMQICILWKKGKQAAVEVEEEEQRESSARQAASHTDIHDGWHQNSKVVRKRNHPPGVSRRRSLQFEPLPWRNDTSNWFDAGVPTSHHPPPPRKTPLPPPPYTTCLLWRRFSQVSNLGDSVSLSYWLHQLW